VARRVGVGADLERRAVGGGKPHLDVLAGLGLGQPAAAVALALQAAVALAELVRRDRVGPADLVAAEDHLSRPPGG
jgi:hypothetical protein